MIRIGNAQVSLERREVFLDGKPILLGGRAFEVLATLIKAKGRVVGKDELLSQVWAGTVVEPDCRGQQPAGAGVFAAQGLWRPWADSDRTPPGLPPGCRDKP